MAKKRKILGCIVGQRLPRRLMTKPKPLRNFRARTTTTTMIKYTNQFLTKLEDLVAESDYILRYEKGNFKSGYCVLKEQKIIIVNKFFTMEGKINTILDILKNVELDTTNFTEKSLKLYQELTATEVKA